MDQTLTVWEARGAQFALDLQDVETAKRYEDAFAAMAEEEQAGSADKLSDALRLQCGMIRPLFDRLLGDGASEKRFGKRENLGEMMEAYEDFLSFVQRQTEAALERRQKLFERFSASRARR